MVEVLLYLLKIHILFEKVPIIILISLVLLVKQLRVSLLR